jgi:ATP-dependent Clp protease ATP-binding subunit ClpC
MAVVEYSYTSPRSEKARISLQLGGIWQRILIVLAVLLFAASLALLARSYAAAWVVFGLAFIPVMIVKWYNGELKNLVPVAKPSSIDDVLDPTVLGLLSHQPTPHEIAAILGVVPGGQFFAARFGIGSQFFLQFASNDTKDMAGVWQSAWDIKERLSSNHISPGILIAALLEAMPDQQKLLAHLQLDIEDIYAGIRWYDHLHSLITKHNVPKRTGGIARDWSFGWTPLLDRFGSNISLSVSGGILSTEIEVHADILNQLLKSFDGSGRQNAALIGPTGVGKTQIIHAFAERLLDATATIPDSLRFNQVYTIDASALLSAAPGRGEIESLLNRILNEAYRSKNIIICFEDAQVFFEDGVGSVDISSILLPVLTAGNLRMILTMDEQRFLKISSTRPELANALNRISIAQTNKPDTLSILQDQIILLEFSQKVTYMYQSLEEAYRLSERYIHDLVMPGRALKLLEAAASFSEQGLVTAHSVQQAIEKTMNIKVGVASSDQDRDKLLNLESLIHERMINQTHAVSAVSDALRRARSGVRNQNRPIGTFMFLGPTGVGKTELAKALAEAYFDGEDHMIRIDMNEFVSSDDVMRLIADGSDDPNSLTAQVMKNPFSVVLLDEIEKAHPSVLTTLLQLLDEGILRDVKNREVSFRDAIIIATSNAGADRIREYIEQGYDIEKIEDQFVNELINSNQFKPEFLNRFDEIVTFRPLKKDELVQVVDLILAGINKTLSLQKVSVIVNQDAKLYLVDAGYDPRLGARPMRRVVQKAVENTVAKQMLAGTVEAGGTITITLEEVSAIVSTKQQADSIVTENVPPNK